MESKPIVEPVQEIIEEIIPTIEPVVEEIIAEPIVEPTVSKIETVQPEPIVVETKTDKTVKPKTIEKEIVTENVTPLTDLKDGYVQFNNGLYNKQALKEIRPDLFVIKADNGIQSNTNFGTQFPKIASKGDIFVRVDVLPNRVFKFDGNKWLEQNKSFTQSYLYNKDYIEFLIEKINSGEYDIDVLSENERSEIESYLNGNQNT